MKAAVPKSHSFTLRRSTEDANLVGRIANPTFPTKDLWAANRWMLQRLQKCNMVQTNMPVTKWEKKHTTCYIVKWCRPFMQRSHCFSVAWDRLLCCLLASNQWSKEHQRESSMPVRVRGGDSNGERKLVSKNWTSNIDWYGASCILHWKKISTSWVCCIGPPSFHRHFSFGLKFGSIWVQETENCPVSHPCELSVVHEDRPWNSPTTKPAYSRTTSNGGPF